MLHLAAAVEPPDRPGAGPYAELARLAEHGRLDFVTLGDPAGRPGTEALDLLGRVVPATRRIGLVPTLAEPWPAPVAVAGADWIGRGRAGWRIAVPATGARPPARRVTAPVSRSPHGRPVRVMDADTKHGRTAAARYADVALVPAMTPAQAAAVGDELRSKATASGRDPAALRVLVSLRVDLGGGEQAAEPGHGGGGPRPSARGPLYRGGPVDLADLVAAWHTEGAADGFHLVPVEPRRDLERLVNGTVALLQHRGLFRTFYPGGTLREHLGLTRGENTAEISGLNGVTTTRRPSGRKEGKA
ncbi:LLM class flavin-dependent oxidoreductase [Streptomyces misionensis]|uniref:LLM class flavin-dependent oxidoreductase n=1 Tax=Streptomyces misionensis TaxID=67331 RepID=A0A5C6JVJ8_9ACTN|nr:LLM class flavin-dependent oxidoreductase [Streptomyces misionensis]TWV48097.1 LLM class flavin-dependent oxidoreductase [Streptomyces misionensis]